MDMMVGLFFKMNSVPAPDAGGEESEKNANHAICAGPYAGAHSQCARTNGCAAKKGLISGKMQVAATHCTWPTVVKSGMHFVFRHTKQGLHHALHYCRRF